MMPDNKKVLILAANGMAGHVISKILEKNNNLTLLKTIRDQNSFSNQQNIVNLDLKDQEQLKQLIKEFNPDYVINCAGILVQDSTDNPLDAIYVNSYLPNLLNQLSEINNFKLIHISTDCVYSGKKGEYTEQDIPDATNVYGRTKALGEINNNKHLTIRTSIIGPELKPNGTGLMHWFFNQSGEINGFTKAIWSGVTTLELAKFIDNFIKYDLANKNNVDSLNISGIYHLTNNQSINKYDLLNLIKNNFNFNHINIKPTDSYSANKSFINTRINISQALSYTVPSYQNMITELRDFMQINKNLYKQYKLFE